MMSRFCTCGNFEAGGFDNRCVRCGGSQVVVTGEVFGVAQRRIEELERHLRACVDGWYNTECGDECDEDFELARAFLNGG